MIYNKFQSETSNIKRKNDTPMSLEERQTLKAEAPFPPPTELAEARKANGLG